jgi:hypothetical protein
MYVCQTNDLVFRSELAWIRENVKRDMVQKEKNNRNRKVTVRFKESEYNKLFETFKTTTKRKFSEYLRDILLNKKITVFTRNQSLDLLVYELAFLRTELSAIDNNYNQTVRKLNFLDDIPQLKIWIEMNQKSAQLLAAKTEEIKTRMDQIADQWLYASTAPKIS